MIPGVLNSVGHVFGVQIMKGNWREGHRPIVKYIGTAALQCGCGVPAAEFLHLFTVVVVQRTSLFSTESSGKS